MPLWSLDETPMMPKGRYGIMKSYMGKVGRLGREMMFRSCTVQTNLDFGSEADMVKKLRVALALVGAQPLLAGLGKLNLLVFFALLQWGAHEHQVWVAAVETLARESLRREPVC